MIKNMTRLFNKRLCKEMIFTKRMCFNKMCGVSLKNYECKIIDKSQIRRKSEKRSNAASVFTPLAVTTESKEVNDVGTELSGVLNRRDVASLLSNFCNRNSVKSAALSLQLEDSLLHQALLSFRRYCVSSNLPTDLHLVLNDIIQGAGHVDDLLPYFLRHAKQVFPHLDCIDDLKQISDLRTPANWYPQARAINRRVIFHAGPTNSGKTYHALERFLTAKSGVYCGPLKLLAAEIYHKSNEKGTPCDLVTGEERRSANFFNKNEETSPEIKGLGESDSSHVACTVEMTSLNTPYEVAIIDEVQLVGDNQRGWAWTRAILGLQAEELHLCGEAGAIPLIEELCHTTGENLEVRKYKRLTQLKVEDKAVCSLDNVQAGDCIVCFSKNDIYSVSRAIENRGMEVAVIYGSLPPGTKLAQAKKFNDPNNPCKVMVATDAIGLGINLSIRRIVFYSLIKPTMNEKGEKEMDILSVSQTLQIAGRAGRYGSAWETGYVTTFKAEDLPTLKSLMAQLPDTVVQAGLHPTAEQMELYAYHLPHASLSSLMDIFVHLCTVDDSMYFMCNTEAFKFLAEMIQHVPLPLRARYVFCCAPINQKAPFVCAMFLKMVRQYSKNEALTWSWVCNAIGWPLSNPKTIVDLVHLEGVFDVLDVYLWLSYRFQDMFPDAHIVRDMQKELDFIIQQGILQITKLLRNSETAISTNTPDEDIFESRTRQTKVNSASSQSTRDDLAFMGNTRGRLTDKLIAQGLLTPKMLKQLKQELGKDDSKKENMKYERKNKPSARKLKKY